MPPLSQLRTGGEPSGESEHLTELLHLCGMSDPLTWLLSSSKKLEAGALPGIQDRGGRSGVSVSPLGTECGRSSSVPWVTSVQGWGVGCTLPTLPSRACLRPHC